MVMDGPPLQSPQLIFAGLSPLTLSLFYDFFRSKRIDVVQDRDLLEQHFADYLARLAALGEDRRGSGPPAGKLSVRPMTCRIRGAGARLLT
jgi:hypothetical protein